MASHEHNIRARMQSWARKEEIPLFWERRCPSIGKLKPGQAVVWKGKTAEWCQVVHDALGESGFTSILSITSACVLCLRQYNTLHIHVNVSANSEQSARL